MEYNDGGDVEDMDIEEYNYAYALWLKEEGWNVEEYEPGAKAVTGTSVKTKKRAKDTAQPTKKKIKETASQKKLAKLQEVFDLTSKATIAGKHVSVMDAEGKNAVVSMLGKTAKKIKIKL